ncbi:Leucyl-tRNA synthetase mitochondrial [Carabus blaptoides fortunei]
MYAVNLTRKCLSKKLTFCFQFRFLSGISAWDEELSSTHKHQIEKYWKDKIWSPTFDEDDKTRDKFYVLSMFPYPSGKLHMGHVRVYTISDTVARYHRMNGKNVLQPIGWDAFGLPAENAAIERNVAPKDWTDQNIAQMKQQLDRLGCSFDWSREIATCEPDYYKWTQYLFLKMFESGLAYQKEALVNWDPIDQTVLAHEQVNENGCSWRSGVKVEKKLLKQWFIRTTKYAKDLLDHLDDPQLQDWRDIIKLQKHWIGECNGVSFDFKLIGTESSQSKDILTLWTSKPELMTMAKFVTVKSSSKLGGYKYEMINGVKRLMIKAENPLTGEKIPVFVHDDIEYELFCDTYLGIPGGFEADRQFAQSVELEMSEETNSLQPAEIPRLQNEICNKAQSLAVGGYWTSAKLQDWLISRQRYWGTPIPIVHCDSCGAQPVPTEQLPVMLPTVSGLSKKGALAQSDDWINTTCPKCGGRAKRETDTMDTFVDSAWYYLRYIDPKNQSEPFSKEQANKLMPVDLYIGGKEHAVLHLYYARFLSHFLYSLGLVPQREPFNRLLVQGMIMGQSYRIKGTGKYLSKSQVNIIDSKKNKAIDKESGKSVVVTWEKMSKSKLNGVDPEEMFEQYGTDTTRLLVLADVAPTSHRNWSTATFPGILNWQHRLWLTVGKFIDLRKNNPAECSEEEFKLHEDNLFDSRNFYIKGATFNYYMSQQMSVAVSKMQGLTNSLRRVPPSVIARSEQFERALAAQIILLAPMAPHFASELWTGFQSAPNRINNSNFDYNWEKSVLEQSWPQVDLDYRLDLLCQTNGHENTIVKIPRKELEAMDYDRAVSIALQQPEVQKILETRKMLDAKFDVYKGYQGVVNILTSEKLVQVEKVANK